MIMQEEASDLKKWITWIPHINL